jgi:hypothetical protein
MHSSLGCVLKVNIRGILRSKWATKENVLSKSTLKEPISFKMMISTIRVNIIGERERKLLFLIIFSTYLLIG